VTTEPVGQRLAALPSVDRLLRHGDTEVLLATHGSGPVTAAIRAELEAARTRVREGAAAPGPSDVVTAVATRLHRARSEDLRRVVNATGVVLHTNLGRAPLSEAARAAVLEAAGYATVEYDLTTGSRGSRTAHVGALAAELCGAEAGLVVNNCAAALLLSIAALADGGEVVVSRGELLEIGGGFRLPEVVAAGGARLREVGTTNRTRVADYIAAAADARLLLKVHLANVRLVGFTSDVSLAELRAVADDSGLPLVYDLGSGAIEAATDGPLADEPTVRGALRAGADLVLCSGDKLLGGPQAGLLVGRADLVERCARHPVARAVRIDKLQRAAMEATLRAHLRGDPVDVPVHRQLAVPVDELRTRAAALRTAVLDGAPAADGAVEVQDLAGAVGGGAVPGRSVPSVGLALAVPSPDDVAATLRAHEPPVIGRIEDGRLLLDLRTVAPEEDALVAAALRQVLAPT
jgi:L-seryl-tRNA(Ser) seleniumtransferase